MKLIIFVVVLIFTVGCQTNHKPNLNAKRSVSSEAKAFYFDGENCVNEKGHSGLNSFKAIKGTGQCTDFKNVEIMPEFTAIYANLNGSDLRGVDFSTWQEIAYIGKIKCIGCIFNSKTKLPKGFDYVSAINIRDMIFETNDGLKFKDSSELLNFLLQGD